ncbi:MAG TPA: hypothetical protein PL037_05025, partial [Elusimicrobiales bacterium]|nr:hypothetical protein [Elusimicrobiales bacterium]
GADLWRVCAAALLLSCAGDIAFPWLYSVSASSGFGLLTGGIGMIGTAALKAVVFPVAHHLSVQAVSARSGRRLSYVYVSNIMGATLGPVFTGVVLLAFFSTQRNFIVVSGFTCLTGLLCLVRSGLPGPAVRGLIAVACVYSLALTTSDPNGFIARAASSGYGRILRIIENQYGVIVAYEGGAGGNVIFGGNVYDGQTNLDPVKNSNHLNRVIVTSALVETPRRVLMIGLSVGSWLKIVTGFPHVERIDVVEINPGYLALISGYPAQASGLRDPRVSLHIDDGRRWLKANSGKRYDLIVMNTTFYWRAYSTGLLSAEFLRLVRRHMAPGAVIAYNATGSPDAFRTAASVFRHAYLYENFVIASDADWRHKLSEPAAFRKLSGLTIDGRPLYPAGSGSVIAAHLKLPLLTPEEVARRYSAAGRELEIITDRNLITEYKYGRSL